MTLVFRVCLRNGQYELQASKVFPQSISAAAVNEDNLIVAGLESGVIEVLQYDQSKPEPDRLMNVLSLDRSQAHHDVVKRLRFNPRDPNQFSSVSADHCVKIHQIRPKTS